MQLTGEQYITEPRDQVWEALNDPTMLQVCIPGCQSLEVVADDVYKIVMQAAVGPFKAKFTGTLTVGDVTPPERYTLAFDGTGGVIGFGRGTAKVTLVDEGDATRLFYESTAQTGGKLAQIGSRLVMGAARKTADDFFERFRFMMEQRAVAGDAT